MKKITILVVLALVLILAVPAFAKNGPVGEAIGWDVTEYPQDTPFHKQHGWINTGVPHKPSISGGYRFELELDGSLLKPDYKIFGYDPKTETDSILYGFNFPQGLTGTHTFTGYYYAPCKDYFDDCKNPAKSVVIAVKTQTVTFTSPP